MKNFVLGAVFGFSVAIGAAHADAHPIVKQNYCENVGANVSADPNPAWNWVKIYDMHSRGCLEYWGKWEPYYLTDSHARCNDIALRHAERGEAVVDVIRHTKKHHCEQFPDGVWK